MQGKTLILHYQVKRAVGGAKAYIAVLPSSGLAEFNLKGLTPEMFCVNISDMVNLRGLISGAVENEQQITVAHWEMNEEEYRHATAEQVQKPTHRQIVALLETLPGYVQELDEQFVDFEENVISHEADGHIVFSGYRLTVVTEDMGEKPAPYAFYNLDTRTAEGWQDIPPPPTDHAAVRAAVAEKLQAIREAGVPITQAHDETDYADGLDPD